MPKSKIPTASESVEQIYLFRWATLSSRTMPELELMYHIPNGGKRNITTAKRLKAEGVKAGVPDICLPVPKGVYHGLYIELKAGKNKTTQNQDEWLEALDNNGYFTAVCYGWEEASKVITNYLKNGGRRENV
ncbi:VRR-NUC domain-containing protein [Ruminiclostridium herbifermentans]